MELSQLTTIDKLRALFASICAQGRSAVQIDGSRDQIGVSLSVRQWGRFCIDVPGLTFTADDVRDADRSPHGRGVVFVEALPRAELDIMFSAALPQGERRIGFAAFVGLLSAVAQRLYARIDGRDMTPSKSARTALTLLLGRHVLRHPLFRSMAAAAIGETQPPSATREPTKVEVAAAARAGRTRAQKLRAANGAAPAEGGRTPGGGAAKGAQKFGAKPRPRRALNLVSPAAAMSEQERSAAAFAAARAASPDALTAFEADEGTRSASTATTRVHSEAKESEADVGAVEAAVETPALASAAAAAAAVDVARQTLEEMQRARKPASIFALAKRATPRRPAPAKATAETAAALPAAFLPTGAAAAAKAPLRVGRENVPSSPTEVRQVVDEAIESATFAARAVCVEALIDYSSSDDDEAFVEVDADAMEAIAAAGAGVMPAVAATTPTEASALGDNENEDLTPAGAARLVAEARGETVGEDRGRTGWDPSTHALEALPSPLAARARPGAPYEVPIAAAAAAVDAEAWLAEHEERQHIEQWVVTQEEELSASRRCTGEAVGGGEAAHAARRANRISHAARTPGGFCVGAVSTVAACTLGVYVDLMDPLSATALRTLVHDLLPDRPALNVHVHALIVPSSPLSVALHEVAFAVQRVRCFVCASSRAVGIRASYCVPSLCSQCHRALSLSLSLSRSRSPCRSHRDTTLRFAWP